MRSILLGLMLIVCGTAWAGVSGEVIGTETDQNGNIMVKVEYLIDGQPIPSPYPTDMATGKSYFVFRLAYTNIEGMTQEQIGAFIDQNVRQHCEALLQRKANEVENAKLNLAPFVGRKVTVDSAEIQVSPTKALTLTTTGKTGERALTPPPEPVDITAKLLEIEGKIDAVQSSTAAIEAKP